MRLHQKIYSQNMTVPADIGESKNDEKDNLEVEHAIEYHYKTERRECEAACLVP